MTSGARADTHEESPTENLRFGIIGVGVMGSNHARVLAELPGVELVAIADPDAATAGKVSNALGCKTVPDHKALIALGVDAVVIAAPTHLHHRIALDCIEASVDI